MKLTGNILLQLQAMEEWDPDALLDALGITSEELMAVPSFYARAAQWAEENTGD